MLLKWKKIVIKVKCVYYVFLGRYVDVEGLDECKVCSVGIECFIGIIYFLVCF